MKTRSIKGATTINKNTISSIENATIEMFSQMIKQNQVDFEDISHIILSATKDINEVYPAKALRKNFDIKDIPLMCLQELEIKGSLALCLRCLVVFNTSKSQKEIKHIYLNNAKDLRPDIKTDVV